MPAAIDGQKLDHYLGASLITAATTMMGLPSIAVPCGFDQHGRPVGLQIVGRHRGEAELLQAAALFEQAIVSAAACLSIRDRALYPAIRMTHPNNLRRCKIALEEPVHRIGQPTFGAV